MARPTAYADPGVYIDEVPVPGGINAVAPPFVLGIVGRGLRTKRISNDPIQRGLVSNETLTLSNITGTVTSLSAPVSGVVTVTIPGNVLLPHHAGATITFAGSGTPANNGSFTIASVPTAGTLTIPNPSGASEGAVATFSIAYYSGVLANLADNRVANTSVRRGARTLTDALVSFTPAYVLGTAAGTFNLSTTNAFALELDNRRGITVQLLDGTDRIHASIVETSAITPITTGITNPSVPSLIAVYFEAGWAGGDVILNGTNAAGVVIGPETITASAGNVVNSALRYATITSIEHTIAAGSGTDAVHIGTADDVAISGQLCRVYSSLDAVGTGSAAATRAQVVYAINAALRNHSTYGSAYQNAALDWTTGILLRATSNVRVFSAVSSTADALVVLFGVAGADNRDARSRIRVNSLAYSASSTYTTDYVRVRSETDVLPQTSQGDAQQIIRVGAQSGSANFTEAVDYARVANTISWDFDVQASYTSTIGTATGNGVDMSGTVGTTALTDIAFGLDGLDVLTFRLRGLASPPLGYADPVAPAEALSSEMAANINAILAASSVYGPRYAATASTVTVAGLDYLVISPRVVLGRGSGIQFRAPTSVSVMSGALGLGATSLPYSVVGQGTRPVDGAFYWATYDITRPTSDYATQRRYFSADTARAALGPASSENPLQMAVELAFKNKANSVCISQVNDASTPGDPTRNEYLAALNATTRSDTVTDVVMLTTDLASQLDLKDHIENQSSGASKHYRRGWFGMNRNTPVGDSDTADSAVYRAVRTLAFAPDSSGRGRAILVMPPQLAGCTIDVTLEDASTERVEVDGTFLAVAWGALCTSLRSPADELANRTITGFNIDDVLETDVWLPGERGEMARNGVFVTTYDGGNLKNLDPVTTEKGGGQANAFSYVAGSKQKDNLRRKIATAMATNLQGVVPIDLLDFVTDIKLLIAEQLRNAVTNNECGAYRSRLSTDPPDRATGPVRDVDIRVDIRASQDPSDQTAYFFKYWFTLRYAALRFYGEFSADTSFFGAS